MQKDPGQRPTAAECLEHFGETGLRLTADAEEAARGELLERREQALFEQAEAGGYDGGGSGGGGRLDESVAADTSMTLESPGQEAESFEGLLGDR